MPESFPFAQRLRQGNTLIGTLVGLKSPEVVELLATCGYDWLFIDAEHGPFLPGDCGPLLQAAGTCPCLIRIPDADPLWIKKALDIGATGVIVPQVHSYEQASTMVAAAKYSPAGDRGVGVGRAHGYGSEFENYLKRANNETAVIVQAESRQAVDHISEIVAVEGIDAILIGPYDLSASLGHIGEITHPQVREAIDTIADTCQRVNMRLGIFGVTPQAVAPYMGRGFTLITVGVDTVFLNQAAAAALTELRGTS